VIAFLAGELSEQEERQFDEHLLGCEICWRAVQADRAGRLALEGLREPAPAGLEGRVTMAIALAARSGDHRRTRPVPRWPALTAPRRRIVIGIAALVSVCALAATLGWLLVGHDATKDPPQVTAVVAMMSRTATPPQTLLGGEDVVIGDQLLHVRAYEIDGKEAIAATSLRPLPMPSASHLLAGSSPAAWMATRGGFSLYGVNRPSGSQSMFLVAAMPMAELPGVAARLNLI